MPILVRLALIGLLVTAIISVLFFLASSHSLATLRL